MLIDEWTRVAAVDDALVADLLLVLRCSGEAWTVTTKMKAVITSNSLSGGLGLATFRWGRRKARSRHGVTRFVTDKEYKKRATRSPTTPLSWSGGTSVSASGNGDGYEASSMMCYGSPASRSKTYIELKEEEGSLLQERQILKTDLATMHLRMARHRMTNKNLKRMKRVNVLSKRMNTSNVVEASMLQGMPSPFTPHDVRHDYFPSRLQASISFDDVPAAKGGESYMLPDLNMPPSIDGEPF